MSSPGIVVDVLVEESISQRFIYNNLISSDEELIRIINYYKSLIKSFSDQKLTGPLPSIAKSDLQVLIYTNKEHLESGNVRKFFYLFYHTSQYMYYSEKLNVIRNACEKWFSDFSINKEHKSYLRNLSVLIGKIVFTSRYIDKSSLLNRYANINLFIQRITTFLTLSKNSGINFISNSEEIRNFLLEIFFKTAWDRIQSFSIVDTDTHTITLENSNITITSFTSLLQPESDISYVFFLKKEYLNDSKVMSIFKEIFTKSGENSHFIVLVEKIDKMNFENTLFFEIITEEIGKSISFTEINNNFELIIESFNNNFNSMINELQRI